MNFRKHHAPTHSWCVISLPLFNSSSPDKLCTMPFLWRGQQKCEDTMMSLHLFLFQKHSSFGNLFIYLLVNSQWIETTYPLGHVVDLPIYFGYNWVPGPSYKANFKGRNWLRFSNKITYFYLNNNNPLITKFNSCNPENCRSTYTKCSKASSCNQSLAF